jgi:hypothetical protein
MHVNVNAGWKAHSSLRRSNKTQILVDLKKQTGSLSVSTPIVMLSPDIGWRRRVCYPELCPALLMLQPLYFFANTRSNISQRRLLEVAKSSVAFSNELLWS